ncbi:MAG: GntR family transcriptional regulator [Clostridia bacterium]|nr:GntR family transcriptional regulator [Clostridia bacterium]
MEISLSILNTSDKPIYRQLYEQLAFQIVTGKLTGGTPLPPIRALASSLGISVISIKRAWEELERDGFIVTMVGRGCFVSELNEDERCERRLELALSELKASFASLKRLEITEDELIALITDNYEF